MKKIFNYIFTVVVIGVIFFGWGWLWQFSPLFIGFTAVVLFGIFMAAFSKLGSN